MNDRCFVVSGKTQPPNGVRGGTVPGKIAYVAFALVLIGPGPNAPAADRSPNVRDIDIDVADDLEKMSTDAVRNVVSTIKREKRCRRRTSLSMKCRLYDDPARYRGRHSIRTRNPSSSSDIFLHGTQRWRWSRCVISPGVRFRRRAGRSHVSSHGAEYCTRTRADRVILDAGHSRKVVPGKKAGEGTRQGDSKVMRKPSARARAAEESKPPESKHGQSAKANGGDTDAGHSINYLQMLKTELNSA